MADKSFGVKELNLLNASGTPTVTSPNNLNLNANTVAISTSCTIGNNLTVTSTTTSANVNVTGIATVVNFNATGISTIVQPADSNPMANWTITNDSNSAYRFTGPGQSGTENNPNIYLVRGHRYIFRHNATSSHPIQIRFANAGSAYTDGITYSDTGNNRTTDGNNLIFNVQHDAPAQLYYQCTSHGSMVGNIYIVGGPQVISGVVTATTFVGNLTGTASANAVLTGSTNNQLVTVTGANAITGESTLNYDASLLNITSTTQGLGLRLRNTGNEYTEMRFDAARTGASSALGILQGRWNNSNNVCAIYLQSGDDTTNKDDGRISFLVHSDASTSKSALRIEPDASIRLPNDSQKLQFGNDQDLNIWHGGTNGYVDNETGSLNFRTTSSNTTRVTIASDGKITTSYQIVNATAPDFSFEITQVDPSNTVNQLGGSGVGLVFKPATNSTAAVGAGIAAIKPGGSDTDTTSDLAFYVSQNDETLDEKLRIASAGQIGLGGANYGSSGQVLTSQGASSAVAWASLAVGKFASYAVVADANNTGNQNAGDFNTGAWRTRILDTEISDTDSIVSLSSNQFTLQAGNYFIVAWASALQVNGHQARLRDVTNSATRAHGSSEYTGNGDYVTTKSWIYTRVTPSSATAYELQHRCQTSCSTVGFGNGSGDQWTQEANGDTYCMVIIFKEV